MMKTSRLYWVLPLAMALALWPTDGSAGLFSNMMKGKNDQPRHEQKQEQKQEQPRSEARPAPSSSHNDSGSRGWSRPDSKPSQPTFQIPQPQTSAPREQRSDNDRPSAFGGILRGRTDQPSDSTRVHAQPEQRSQPQPQPQPQPRVERPEPPVTVHPRTDARQTPPTRSEQRESAFGRILRGNGGSDSTESRHESQPRVERPEPPANHDKPAPGSQSGAVVRPNQPQTSGQRESGFGSILRGRTTEHRDTTPGGPVIKLPEDNRRDSSSGATVVHPRRPNDDARDRRQPDTPPVISGPKNDKPAGSDRPTQPGGLRWNNGSSNRPSQPEDIRDRAPSRDDRRDPGNLSDFRRDDNNRQPDSWNDFRRDDRRGEVLPKRDGTGLWRALLGADGVDKEAFHRRLRELEARQHRQVSFPRDVYFYRSPRPSQNHDRWRDIWDECRDRPSAKRDFWRRWTGHTSRVRVVTQYRYIPTPVYQYWPSSWGGYHYWGWDDCRDNDLNLVVVYAPPSTSSYTLASGGSSYTYVADSRSDSQVQWPGYREDKADAEKAAKAIEKAWENDDTGLMNDYVDKDVPVRYYESGEYLYWMNDSEFISMVSDDMSNRGTKGFTVEAVIPVRPGEVMFYARHDLDRGTQYERYTLEKLGDRWAISAYELSADKLISR